LIKEAVVEFKLVIEVFTLAELVFKFVIDILALAENTSKEFNSCVADAVNEFNCAILLASPNEDVDTNDVLSEASPTQRNPFGKSDSNVPFKLTFPNEFTKTPSPLPKPSCNCTEDVVIVVSLPKWINDV
jgi:hypothetical protein